MSVIDVHYRERIFNSTLSPRLKSMLAQSIEHKAPILVGIIDMNLPDDKDEKDSENDEEKDEKDSSPKDTDSVAAKPKEIYCFEKDSTVNNLLNAYGAKSTFKKIKSQIDHSRVLLCINGPGEGTSFSIWSIPNADINGDPIIMGKSKASEPNNWFRKEIIHSSFKGVSDTVSKTCKMLDEDNLHFIRTELFSETVRLSKMTRTKVIQLLTENLCPTDELTSVIDALNKNKGKNLVVYCLENYYRLYSSVFIIGDGKCKPMA